MSNQFPFSELVTVKGAYLMNLIGKILVGVIFVMSIVFMTLGIVLYSTQRDWKDKFNKAQDEQRQAKTDNDRLEQRLASLKDEKERLVVGLEDDIAKLAAENNYLTQENNRLNMESRDNLEAVSIANQTLTSTQLNMTNLRKDWEETQKLLEVAKSELHKQFAEMVAETDKARTLAMDLASLKSTSDVLNKDLADARYLLTQLGYGDLAPAIYDAHLRDIPPRVSGTITDIRPNGLLEINIGRDDGLLQGHKLHVYRDNQGVQSYLGRIEIIDVKPGVSVGRIMPEYRSGTILRNDNVTAYVSQVTASL